MLRSPLTLLFLVDVPDELPIENVPDHDGFTAREASHCFDRLRVEVEPGADLADLILTIDQEPIALNLVIW